MTATGIVRRIDDLGRIVLPKELRRNLRLRAGAAMEIFTEGDGSVRLRKYSPIRDDATPAQELAESMAQVCGHVVIITDMDAVIAAAGDERMKDKEISVALETAINGRKPIFAAKEDRSQFINILSDVDCPFEFAQEIVVPIIPEGDSEGAVIILSKNTDMGDVEMKLARTAAAFIGNQMRL